MTEYWKSYAKKFCEICKCWYADNKVSAERHEQGLRHKVMVQQRLRDSAKKAKDKEVEDHDLKMTLLAMEQAARASISSQEQRDVPMLPAPRALSSQKFSAEANDLDDVKAKLKEQKRKLAELKKRSKQSQFWTPDEQGGGNDLAIDFADVGDGTIEWVQAETPDGQFYYWHIFTGETRWEPPEQFHTAAQYAAHYADIAAEATDEGQFANSVIDPQFVPQMTVAEVNSQMALEADEVPTPVKRYYGMREGRHQQNDPGGGRTGRRVTDEDKNNSDQQLLTREERRKIRRERKAMNANEEDGSRIPEGLVELKTETFAATDGGQFGEEIVPKLSNFSAHPLGPWIPVKKEEKRPDLDALELEPKEKKRTKCYDDLPEQSYVQGSADYSQTPAELLEVAELDPDELAFKTKQMGQQQTTAKRKVIGFRKPGSSHTAKSLRSTNKN
uniref:WW domain-binding protein 4 n=1 Tax=Globodera rostochiensis TaxID=31243 RepID=A0A914H524_GLORO